MGGGRGLMKILLEQTLQNIWNPESRFGTCKRALIANQSRLMKIFFSHNVFKLYHYGPSSVAEF